MDLLSVIGPINFGQIQRIAHKSVVNTPSGSIYYFCIGDGDVAVSTNSRGGYYKSTDYGLTWTWTQIYADTNTQAISVWYDRWSASSGDLIHMVYCSVSTDDVIYRNLDTTTDTLSSPVNIYVGATATAANTNAFSIVKALGGNLYVYYDIDGGVETGFYRSTDGGGTWASRSSPFEATGDIVVLAPGYAADTQDIMAFFWDISADEISRKNYDDSANTWSETSISTGMVDATSGTAFYDWDCAADYANSKNYLIAWNGRDTANADLLCWEVTDSSITAKTDVVTNVTDDTTLAGLTLYGSALYAYWCGATGGGDLVPTNVGLYYKISTDGGTSWSSAIQSLPPADIRRVMLPDVSYHTPRPVLAASSGVPPTSAIVIPKAVGTNGQIGMN